MKITSADLRDYPRRSDVGFYLIRRVRNGPLVPMRVFIGRVGGLYIEVGGEPVEFIYDAPWPPRERITEVEYHHRLRLREWLIAQGQNDRAPVDASKLPPLV